VQITTQFDIGQTVSASGDAGVVKSITIGTDRTVYYLVEFPVVVDAITTTYREATLPESALTAA